MGRPLAKYNFMKIFIDNTKFNITTGCLEWTGTILPNGYGEFSVNNKTKLSHRFFFEYFGGYIPGNYEVDHLCRNRKCVNIEHLEAVSHSINIKRGNLPERYKTHCPNGHVYSPENTKIRRGKRECIICTRINDQIRRINKCLS